MSSVDRVVYDEHIIYSSFDLLLNAIQQRKNILLSQLKDKYQNNDNIHVEINENQTNEIIDMINQYGCIKIDSDTNNTDKDTENVKKLANEETKEIDNNETDNNEIDSFWNEDLSDNDFIINGNVIYKQSEDDTFCNAFSKQIISSPITTRWKLQINKSLDNEAINCVIGIIDTNNVNKCTDGDFAESHNEGYALSAHNGNIYHSDHFGIKYANKLIENDIICVELDMKNGTLKYIVNDKDYGIAFNNIDTQQSYHFAIAMDLREEIKVLDVT